MIKSKHICGTGRLEPELPGIAFWELHCVHGTWHTHTCTTSLLYVFHRAEQKWPILSVRLSWPCMFDIFDCKTKIILILAFRITYHWISITWLSYFNPLWLHFLKPTCTLFYPLSIGEEQVSLGTGCLLLEVSSQEGCWGKSCNFCCHILENVSH